MENQLYLQYIKKGEEEIVWNKIAELGDLALTSPYQEDVLLVVNECMKRVSDNFIIAKEELENNGYIFENIGDINHDYCVVEFNTAEIDLPKLQELFPEGYLPYSLLYFYKNIRAIDFRGSFSNWDNPYFMDAIYIFSLEVFFIINDTPWEYRIDESSMGYKVLISPDEFVKEDTSGGGGYGLELHSTKRIDSNMLGFAEYIPFIEYLRLCLKWGGLAGLEGYEGDDEEKIPDEIMQIILRIREKMKAI